MKISTKLQPSAPLNAEIVFREVMEPSIRRHLLGLGMQSSEQLESTVRTLRDIHVGCASEITAQFFFSAGDAREEQLKQTGQCDEIKMIVDEMARLVIAAQEQQLIQMATHLATNLSDKPLTPTLH